MESRHFLWTPAFFENNTLVISSVKKSHKGSYTCKVTNALSSIQASVQVKSNSPSSCSVIRKYVSSSSGNYVIDPDGAGGLAPFTIHCDMSDKNCVGVTVISHDSESRTLLDGYDGQGDYIRAAFTTQEQVYLSWPVLLMSLSTANSSLNMSVMALGFGLQLQGAGGCHVILIRCGIGAEHCRVVTSAHAE